MSIPAGRCALVLLTVLIVSVVVQLALRLMDGGAHAAPDGLSITMPPVVVPIGGAEVESDFELMNPSLDHTLSFTKVRMNCGCLSISPSEVSIGPGSTSIVSLRGRIPCEAGQHRFAACFSNETDDSESLCIRLFVTGYPAISVEPDIAPFFYLKHGKKPESRQFTVTTARRKSTTNKPSVLVETDPEDAMVTESHSTVVVDQGIRIDKRTYEISAPVNYAPGRSNPFSISVRFIFGENVVERNIFWVYEHAVVASPSSIFIVTSPRKSTQSNILLSSTSPFSVANVESSVANVNAKLLEPVTQKKLAEIVLACDQIDTQVRSSTGQLRIYFGEDNIPPLSIPLFLTHR